MAVRVVLIFPSKPTHIDRFDHWDDVEAFFSPFAQFEGFGGNPESSIDLFLGIPDGVDVKAWVAQTCATLREVGAPVGTTMAIFPEDHIDVWQQEWWRVDLFGPYGNNGPRMMRIRNDYDAPDGLVELGYVDP